MLPDESAYRPSAQDGLGSVVVTPEVVPVRSPVTMTFRYTADRLGIAVGGGVACHVSQFWGWTPPQLVDPTAPGYVTVYSSDPAVVLDPTCDGQNQVVVVRMAGKMLEGGQTLTFTYGDTGDGEHPEAQGLSDRFSEREERFFFKVDGDGDSFFTPLEKQPFFQVVADQPQRLFLLGPSRAQVGETVELTLAVLDGADNLVESFTGEIDLAEVGGGLNLPKRIAFTPDKRGAVRITAQVVAEGPAVVKARDAAGQLQLGQSNPILCGPSQQELYNLYWGDLHIHSNKSDGTATPEEVFRYARDVARLDVAALTDHDHWGYRPLDEDPATWRRMGEVADRFHEPGKFVSFLGYEWTNWTYGHRNVVFLNTPEAKVYPWHRPESDEPGELWALLGSTEAITIPHHPGGGPMPIYWPIHDPKFQPLVEITSVHGVSEVMGHPKTIYSPEPSGMVQSALARGYHLGIVGSGDTHDGHPGMRSLTGGTSGLMGIYATSLTRAAIFEAIRARRVYATTGCRAVLRFRMGSTGMGGIVPLERPDMERKLTITVSGDAPLLSIALVKNDREVAQWPGEGLITSVEWTDPNPAVDGDYYYARIVQTDGEWIWSSPIWVKLGKGSGFGVQGSG